MIVNLTRTQIEKIFEGEVLSEAARFVLKELIEMAMPANDALVDEVLRIIKENGKISAIRWIREKVASNPDVADRLRDYHPEPNTLAGAKTIVEKIFNGPNPPPPLATLLPGEEV